MITLCIKRLMILKESCFSTVNSTVKPHPAPIVKHCHNTSPVTLFLIPTHLSFLSCRCVHPRSSRTACGTALPEPDGKNNPSTQTGCATTVLSHAYFLPGRDYVALFNPADFSQLTELHMQQNKHPPVVRWIRQTSLVSLSTRCPYVCVTVSLINNTSTASGFCLDYPENWAHVRAPITVCVPTGI